LQVKKSVVDRIQSIAAEYVKIFQNTDQHSTDYIQVLGNEERIIAIVRSACKYQEDYMAHWTGKVSKEQEANMRESICKAYVLLVNHLHYKYNKDPAIEAELNKMYNFIYEHDPTNRVKMQCVLLHVYHLALHDRWHEARDLFNMTHMTQNIDSTQEPTHKILYNRAIAQLGLAGFRRGNMQHASQCLNELQQTNRVKELMAQGLQNLHYSKQAQERTAEEEALQRMRLLPYHMHINLDLLDCAYLVATMINEIPFLAQNEFNGRRKPISKPFYNLLRQSEKNSLNAPPDHHKDSLMLAAKAMKLGDWRKCVGFVINEKLNKTIWSRFNNSAEVIKMLEEKLKVECLRTYMFTYSQFYTNISNEWLSDNFELPQEQVQRIVTKLMLEDNLQGSWDGPTGTVVLHGTEPTRLQNIALQLSQKVAQIQEQNEKIASGEKGMATLGRNYTNYNNDRKKFDKNRKDYKGGRGDQGENKGKRDYHNKGGNYRQNNRNNYNKQNNRAEE